MGLSRKDQRIREKHRRGGHNGPHFIQLFHYMKRSVEYHGLSTVARTLLIELIDRYNGNNNGMIALSVREAAYELHCSQSTISQAFRELDDAGLVRPMKVGVWRGRRAEEYRLMWRRCDKTGELPRTQWKERKPYVQLLLPAPRKEPLSDAERARRYRQRQTENERSEVNE